MIQISGPVIVGRITSEESLFWYIPGWDTSTYSNTEFVPNFPPDPATVDSAITLACNFEQTCIFDAVAVNSTEVGEYTTLVQNEVLDKRQTLGKFRFYLLHCALNLYI